MTVISLDTIIECCNDLVDETEALRDRMDGWAIALDATNNNIDRLTAQLQAANKHIDELTEQLVAEKVDRRMEQILTRLDALERTEAAAQQTVKSSQTVSLKRLPRRTAEEKTVAPATAQTEAVESAPVVEEKTVAPAPTEAVAPAPSPAPAQTVAPTPTPTDEIDVLMNVVQTAQKKQTVAPSSAPAPKTAIAKRAMARQYMIETGMGVEQLRNPTAISEVLASPEFEAWLEKK